MDWTTEEYRAMLTVHRALVEVGAQPQYAGELVRRAAARAKRTRDAGVGKFKMHRFERPVGMPRPVIAGEQCVRIDMSGGNEAAAYEQLQKYRDQGWSVTQITPYKGAIEAYYACPPGQLPRQHEPLILQAEEPTTFTTERIF